MADTTLFIDLVRSKPCLYDIKHESYKDSVTVKANNWTDIAKEWKEISNEELTSTYSF